MIGKPLDRSKNPVVALGTQLDDITGVVEYAYVPLQLNIVNHCTDVARVSQIWNVLRYAYNYPSHHIATRFRRPSVRSHVRRRG